jgi:hypothetical protein
MKRIHLTVALGALACTLAGCAYEGPAGNGDAVRAIMASQIIPARPHADTGSDGAAAAAAYANYKQSYATPVPQNDGTLVGAGRK